MKDASGIANPPTSVGIGVPPIIGAGSSVGASALSFIQFNNKVKELQIATFGCESTSTIDIGLSDALIAWRQVCIELGLTDMKIYQLLDGVASSCNSVSNYYNKAKDSISTTLNYIFGNDNKNDYTKNTLSEEEIKKLYEKYLENMQKEETERLRIQSEREENLKIEAQRIQENVDADPNILMPGQTVELNITGPTSISAGVYRALSSPTYLDVMYINPNGEVTNIVDDAHNKTSISAYTGKLIIKNESIVNVKLEAYIGYKQNWIASDNTSYSINSKVINSNESFKFTNNTKQRTTVLVNNADSYQIKNNFSNGFSSPQSIKSPRRISLNPGEIIHLQGESYILYSNLLCE